jgi:hypothetical protein
VKTPEAVFLEPTFIEALRQKAWKYRFRTSGYKDSTGQALSTEIMEDPVFREIYSIREWERFVGTYARRRASPLVTAAYGEEIGMLRRRRAKPWKELPAEVEQIAEPLSNAIRDLPAFRKNVHKLDFIEGQWKHPLVGWHHCTAIRTILLLKQGVVPTKKTLRAAARQLKTELLDFYQGEISEAEHRDWLREPTPRQWTRIIKDLDLSGLPNASGRQAKNQLFDR